MVQLHIIREIEIGKFVTHRAWKKYLAYLKRPCSRSQQSIEKGEMGKIWVTAFLRIWGWSAFGFPGQGQIGQFRLEECGFDETHRRSYPRRA